MATDDSSALADTALANLIESAVDHSHSDEMFDRPLVWPAGRPAFISYVDGVFEESFCSTLIEWCEEHPQRSKRGQTMGGVMLNTKVSTDWNLDGNYETPENQEQEFDARLFKGLWKVIRLYQKSYGHLQQPENIHQFAVRDLGYQIQKYDRNVGFYNEHTDGAPWATAAILRTLGVIVYLNDVSVGGGTNFPLHNITVGAVTGRVAVFPAYWTHPHQGLMPESSDKWIVSSFVEGAPPSSTPCTCDGENHEH